MGIQQSIRFLAITLLALVWLVSALHPLTFSAASWSIVALVGLTGLLVYRYADGIQGRLNPLLDRLTLNRLTLLALVLRLGALLAWPNEQISDFGEYRDLAITILNGATPFFPHRPPGTPIVTAVLFWLFGRHDWIALIPVLFLSTWQVRLLGVLAGRLWSHPYTGRLAALLLAIHPEQLLYSKLIATDVYFSFLILAGLVVLTGGRSWSNAVWAGLLFGLAHYFRATGVLALMAILLALDFNQPVRRPLAHLLLTGLVFLLTVSPIIRYNYQQLHVVSLNPYHNGGWVLLTGSNITWRGHYNTDDLRLLDQTFKQAHVPPNTSPYLFRDGLARQLAFKRVQANWPAFLWFVVSVKPFTYWGELTGMWALAGLRNKTAVLAITTFCVFWHRLLLLLAGWSLFRLARSISRHGKLGLLAYLAFALLTTGAHLLIEVQGRYHFMFLPLLVLVIAGRYAQLQTTPTAPVRMDTPY